MNSHIKTHITVIASLLLTAAAHAQKEPVDERQIAELLEKTLPSYDSSVLDVKDGPDWSAKLEPDTVLKAFGEEPFKMSADPRRIDDGKRVLRLTPEIGKVRFVQRARTWDPAQTAKEPVDAKVAQKLAINTLIGLGLPRAEFASPRTDLQLGLDEDKGNAKDSQLHTLYSLVSVHRTVGKLEVYGSRARVAVTNDGNLQRIRIGWPAFRLARALTLRKREEVIKQAVATIVRQVAEALPDVELIRARLAYVPELATLPYVERKPVDEQVASPSDDKRDADDDASKLGTEKFEFPKAEPVQYLPAAVISVAAAPTPYELLIPLAE